MWKVAWLYEKVHNTANFGPTLFYGLDWTGLDWTGLDWTGLVD